MNVYDLQNLIVSEIVEGNLTETSEIITRFYADELVKTLKRFGVETSLIKTNNYCKMHGLPMRRKVRK